MLQKGIWGKNCQQDEMLLLDGSRLVPLSASRSLIFILSRPTLDFRISVFIFFDSMKKKTPNKSKSQGNSSKASSQIVCQAHIIHLDHIRLAVSPFYFWPIIYFSVFPAQFWIFSKWCLVLSLWTLFNEISQILAKFIFFSILTNFYWSKVKWRFRQI